MAFRYSRGQKGFSLLVSAKSIYAATEVHGSLLRLPVEQLLLSLKIAGHSKRTGCLHRLRASRLLLKRLTSQHQHLQGLAREKPEDPAAFMKLL